MSYLYKFSSCEIFVNLEFKTTLTVQGRKGFSVLWNIYTYVVNQQMNEDEIYALSYIKILSTFCDRNM